MNKVASPCCGSCRYYTKDSSKGRYYCHNKKEILFYGFSFPERICAGNSYSPRNPIPITDLPGVKELVKDAYRAGYTEKDDWPCDKAAIDWLTDEYMKALEAK